MLDTLIRDGLVVDGTGRAPYRADIGIRDGMIAAVGEVGDTAHQTIDAKGLVVTPGFVDVHTHYDGQVTWDPYLTPSSLHGVTTIVMGNCGVGFAPVRERDRDWLIRLMEGVEDIPGTTLSEGIRWQWESFPDYLEALKTKSFALDVAAQIPHGPLRTYVMGARGADHRVQPTDDEIEAMASSVLEAMRSGAVGFSTSRTLAHRSSDGSFTPSLSASSRELLAIAAAMKSAGRGVIEIVSDFNPLEDEFALIREIALKSERPVSVALTQTREQPEAWRRVLDLIGAARADGLEIHGQVTARPINILMGLSNRAHFLMASPIYRQVAALPLDEQIPLLLQADTKSRILDDLDLTGLPSPIMYDWENFYCFTQQLPYLPDPGHSVAKVAARQGVSAESIAYDWLVEADGRNFLFSPMRNYVEGDARALRQMIGSKFTIIGLGDAGAHCGMLCDASMPTFFLSHWRDRTDGTGFSLEFIVHELTQRPAEAWGFTDRGIISVGKRADLNLIDIDALALQMPVYQRDLPAGGGRLMQRAQGYTATLVKGAVVRLNGQATGALPGRLIV